MNEICFVHLVSISELRQLYWGECFHFTKNTELEINLLRVVLRQTNMTHVFIPNSEVLGTVKIRVYNSVWFLFLKEYAILLGSIGKYFQINSFLPPTITITSWDADGVHRVLSNIQEWAAFFYIFCGSVNNCGYMDCDWDSFDYTCWSIKLHVGV